MLLLSFSEFLPQAQRLADRLEIEQQMVYCHQFPDKESFVRLPTQLPDHVIICRSLNQPNNKLIELLLCAETARQLGAKRLTLVAPYLCYMRQDIANHPGEAVSQRIIGKLLAQLFDDVITVDPHLHRISTLNQAIPNDKAISLTAGHEIGAFLQQKFASAVLLGPDGESEQWVAGIAGKIGFEYAVATKNREGDQQVTVLLPNVNFDKKTVIIIDDVISTGRTVANAAKLLLKAGSQAVYVAATHPLFCGDAMNCIQQAGVKQIWCTDSVNHSTASIQLDKLLARSIQSIS